ncbi:AAA family ATPase [Synechococcus moorigangaii CMS01]|nr:AAA family ATPase [Synechococcus moorigangaii CMS01]
MIPDPNTFRNETEVESKLIVHYLLPELGYTPDTWYQEVAFGRIRLDFMAFTSKVMPFTKELTSPLSLIIEAKSPRKKLDYFVGQIRDYMVNLLSPYGVLTNGREFRIYELTTKNINLCFQCTGEEIQANIETIKSLIAKDAISNFSLKTNLQPVDQATHPLNPRTKQMKIIAVYHNKGGVGKTTTVVNLAAAIQRQGKKVLIIDLDSQANTTYATGLAKFLDESDDTIQGNNALQLIESKDKYSIADIVRPASYVAGSTIDVIPSHIEMMYSEDSLNRTEAAKTRLVKKLKAVQDHYDIVLIDTPPSLNLYARIALLSSDYLLIPSDLKPFANEGLSNVKNFITEVNETKEVWGLKPLEILGVLASKISTNHKFINGTYLKRRAMIKERYGFPLMESAIFEREDLAKSIEHTIEYGEDEIPDPISVFDYNPNSKSASEFEALAIEVLQKI